MKLFTSGLLSIFVILFTFSCSSTENISPSGNTSSSSIFPGWYQSSEFLADSLSYTGFATAIGSDSALAVERAEIQARAHLESNIAELTEEIRTGLEESGSTSVSNTDFIIILRSAHSKVESAGTLSMNSVKQEDGYYRGFASVDISKEELVKVLETGFKGHPRYWGEFSGSAEFARLFN